jgi:hypothetical protein
MYYLLVVALSTVWGLVAFSREDIRMTKLSGNKLIHHDVDEDEREESEVDTDQGVHGHA